MIVECSDFDRGDLLSIAFKLDVMKECAGEVGEILDVEYELPAPLKSHGVDKGHELPSVIVRHRHPRFDGFLYHRLFENHNEPYRKVSWLLGGNWNLKPFIVYEPIFELRRNLPSECTNTKKAASWLIGLSDIVHRNVQDHDLSQLNSSLNTPDLLSKGLAHYLICKINDESNSDYSSAEIKYTFASLYGPPSLECRLSLLTGEEHQFEVLPELVLAWGEELPEVVSIDDLWMEPGTVSIRGSTRYRRIKFKEVDHVLAMRAAQKFHGFRGNVVRRVSAEFKL